MMTPGSVGAAAAPVRSGAAETLSNRFLVSSVAFLRAKQLQGGARCHLEANGHKPTHLAVLEVLADTISWSAA
jgi:DNA-directed RNA polymerase subunit K/omega